MKWRVYSDTIRIPRNIFSSLFRACIEFGCWRYTKEYLISKNTMDTTHEISNLVKKSPKRNAMLQKRLSIFSSRVSRILYTLSYRWTVSGESLKSTANNWGALQRVWDESLDKNSEPELRGRIIGVRSQMDNYDYFYVGIILELV